LLEASRPIEAAKVAEVARGTELDCRNELCEFGRAPWPPSRLVWALCGRGRGLRGRSAADPGRALLDEDRTRADLGRRGKPAIVADCGRCMVAWHGPQATGGRPFAQA